MQMNLEPKRPRQRFSIWLLFFLAAGTLLTENFLDYPLGIPRMRRLAGGLPLLDLRLWYTSESAYKLFDTLGEDGRRAYLQLLWSVDVWLPLICALFLSEAIRRGRLQRFSWLPAFVAGCDYAENTVITVLLFRFPTQLPLVVLFSSSLTLLKYIGYLITIVIAVTGHFTRGGSHHPPGKTGS